MTEQKLWQDLKPQFSHHCDFSRLENVVGTGMPDVNGCRFGVEAWIELKIFDHNKIHLRPQQPQWIARRMAHGGRVWVLCYRDHPTTTNRFGDLVLYNGSVVPLLLKSGVAGIDGVRGPKADPKSITQLATLLLTGTSTCSTLEQTIFA